MIEKISLDLIDDFNNHPFKVVEDESLKELADSINEKEGTNFTENNIIMTVGAAGGLNVILKTIINPDDEVILYNLASLYSQEKNYQGAIGIYDKILANNSVDLNEELVDLVKYQTAYSASAQVFNTCNNCLDVLMNLGG